MQYSRASATERRTMPPAIAVSAVAFAIEPPAGARIGDAQNPGSYDALGADGTTLWIPLVRRTREPFAHHWALPGGPTEWHETLTDTAMRTLTDAVLRPPGYLEQLYAFGAIERSAQAQRLVTIAYWAQYGAHDLAITPTDPSSLAAGPTEAPKAAPTAATRWDDPRPEPGAPAAAPAAATAAAPTPAASFSTSSTDSGPTHLADTAAPDPNVAWFSADRLPPLAFDHAEIVAYALWRLRIKTEYSSVAHRFLGSEFTLAQLRGVHEAILGQKVDPANFRRQLLASGDLAETGAFTTGGAHRPAKLYRFRGDNPHTPPDRPHTTTI